ncbi:MAG: hypothetical protein QOH41_3428 [Blastocatellia bacterium]|jgi:hypothetical protein|nr:hypothetical protein [Blastocatellia bacterium]
MSYRVVSYKNLARLLVAAIFSLCLAGTTLGQGKPGGVGPPPNNNPNVGDRIRQIDEGRLRGAETNVSLEEENQKRLQAAIVNMKDDYKRIQVLRNDIARNLVARKTLEYKLVAEQTGEINKRASRLNIYMQARVPAEEKPSTVDDLKNEEMVGALVKLCKLIDSFTENPALKNAATVDSKDVAKSKEDKSNADRDLLAIIKLSSGIQRKSVSLTGSQ